MTTPNTPAEPQPQNGSGFEMNPKYVAWGVVAVAVVAFPLAAAAVLTARFLMRRDDRPGREPSRYNPWLGLVVALLGMLGLLVVTGIPDVTAAVGSLTAVPGLLGADLPRALLTWVGAGGVWAVLVGFTVGTGWLLWHMHTTGQQTVNPLVAVKARRLRRRIATRPGPHPDAENTPAVTLGTVRDHPETAATLSLRALNGGTVVLGATGAGKTTTVTSGILADMVAAGHPVVYVDMKGSADVPVTMAGLAAQHGRPFWHFTLIDPTSTYVGPAAEGPAGYNPAGYGDATRRANLLMGALGSENPYFANITAAYTQVAYQVLLRSGDLAGQSALHALYKVLNPAELQKAATRIPDDDPEKAWLLRQADDQAAIVKTPDGRSAVGAMRTYLSGVLDGVAGSHITNDGDVIDFAEVDRCGGVVVFSLSDLQYPTLAGTVGSLIIQDLSTYGSVREQDTHVKSRPFVVVVDEFSALGRGNILGLVARGRSAGMSTILATQNMADLSAAGTEAFRDQVLGTATGFVLMRANTRSECDVLSGLTGDATPGHDPETMGPDPRYAPWTEFQSLHPGEAVVVQKTSTAGRLQRVSVLERDVPEVEMVSLSGFRQVDATPGARTVSWLRDAHVDDGWMQQPAPSSRRGDHVDGDPVEDEVDAMLAEMLTPQEVDGLTHIATTPPAPAAPSPESEPVAQSTPDLPPAEVEPAETTPVEPAVTAVAEPATPDGDFGGLPIPKRKTPTRRRPSNKTPVTADEPKPETTVEPDTVTAPEPPPEPVTLEDDPTPLARDASEPAPDTVPAPEPVTAGEPEAPEPEPADEPDVPAPQTPATSTPPPPPIQLGVAALGKLPPAPPPPKRRHTS